MSPGSADGDVTQVGWVALLCRSGVKKDVAFELLDNRKFQSPFRNATREIQLKSSSQALCGVCAFTNDALKIDKVFAWWRFNALQIESAEPVSIYELT